MPVKCAFFGVFLVFVGGGNAMFFLGGFCVKICISMNYVDFRDVLGAFMENRSNPSSPSSQNYRIVLRRIEAFTKAKAVMLEVGMSLGLWCWLWLTRRT